MLDVARCCTDGTRNACSFLYVAAVRAARALGYEVVITYIQAGESGTSLLPAGFVKVADVAGDRSWSCASRPRPTQGALFDEPQRQEVPRERWEFRII